MLVHSLLSFALVLFRVYVKAHPLNNVYVPVCDFNLYILNDGATMRIYIKGFGCSSSLADTETLAGCLARAGHKIVGTSQKAELIIYNTCAVKTPTENRMISLLRRIPKEKKFIVAGCLPLINFERLSREARFDGVVGPAFGEKIVEVVEQVSRGVRTVSLEDAPENMPPLSLSRIRVNPKVSIIPISYGCLGSCAYCCVRFARGKLRSYGIGEIVSRVEEDYAEGVCEFWLTSQDTACYGKDVGTDLARLLESVCSVDGDFFVRVGMMTPNNLLEILEPLLEAFQNDKAFRFLHLPVQSGDDDVLRGMNRLYLTEDFATAVKRFRKAFSQSTVATDVIVGFPGETEEAFKNTWKLIEDTRPDIVNVSKFFPRPGTAAACMKTHVTPSEVKQRSTLLAGLARNVAREQNDRWRGWSGRVLVDEVGRPGTVVGRNSAYKPIVIRTRHGQGLLGQFVSVKVTDAFQSYLLGRVL